MAARSAGFIMAMSMSKRDTAMPRGMRMSSASLGSSMVMVGAK